MKKILIIILVLFIGMYMFYYMNKKEDNNIINNFEEDRYVFISYIDYSYLKGKDENILKEEINKMVRLLGCQFIIATHSPFMLGTLNAKIYNLDAREYEVTPWYKLENVRYFYDFFKKHEKEFND